MSQGDSLDRESLLATVAHRMLKLGYTAAAAALADSNISAVHWRDQDWVVVDVLVGGENYDSVVDPALVASPDPESLSILATAFRAALPPGTAWVDVRFGIRNDPVTDDWREVDGQGNLRPAARRPIAHLDPTQIPVDSDIVLHLARLNRLDQEPEEMIGAAKDLVEATAKLVLLRLNAPPPDGSDVAAVSKLALTQLNLHPETVAPTAKGAETIRRILAGLQQMAAGLAELRNMGYGTGHGRGQRVGGLAARHAELAARAASAYVSFILATLNEPTAPWRKRREPSVNVVAIPRDPPQTRSFRDGDRVSHARWGDGIVISSRMTRSDEEVTIAFRDPATGRKTLLASLAQLERLPQT